MTDFRRGDPSTSPLLLSAFPSQPRRSPMSAYTVTPKYAGPTAIDPAPNGYAPTGHPMWSRTSPSFTVTADEYRDTRYVLDAKIAVFRTHDHESMAAMREVVDRICNGRYFLLRREMQSEDEPETGRKGWAIYMEWVEPQGVLG